MTEEEWLTFCWQRGDTVAEAEWLACTSPAPMLEFLRGRASDRKLRLFAAACCRTVWELLPDELSRRALLIAELAADGQADPRELRNVLEVSGPKVNTQYGIFLCGGCGGPGSTYAAMAAVATVDPGLTFTWYMGQTPSETHTAWECAARAKAQTAKEAAQEKRWEERDAVATDSDEEPDDSWHEEMGDAGYAAWDEELAAARSAYCALLHDVFGPMPFRPPPPLAPSLLTRHDGLIRRLAEDAYQHRIMPAGTLDSLRLNVLADALEEAGADAALVRHLREPGSHYRGCWGLDLLLGED